MDTTELFASWIKPEALAIVVRNIFPARYFIYTETKRGSILFLYPIHSYRYVEDDASCNQGMIDLLDPLSRERCEIVRDIARERGYKC